MSTRTAMTMKQISMRDLLSSQVSLVVGFLGLLLFPSPPVVETALGAGKVEFWAVVEEKDGRVLCISKVVVWLLKLRLRGEFVLASVLFWLSLRSWLMGLQVPSLR